MTSAWEKNWRTDPDLREAVEELWSTEEAWDEFLKRTDVDGQDDAVSLLELRISISLEVTGPQTQGIPNPILIHQIRITVKELRSKCKGTDEKRAEDIDTEAETSEMQCECERADPSNAGTGEV